MLRAGAALSTAPEARRAAEEASAAALAQAGGRADSALLFATQGYGADLPELLDAAVGCLGTEAVVGASAHGVLAAGQECERVASVAVLAQAGLEAHPFLLSGLRGDEAVAGEEIAARLGGPPRPEDLVVLLPDAGLLQARPLLEGLRASLEPARIVGAGAASALSETPLQWCGRSVDSGALAGIVLRAARPPRLGVTQACQPVTDLLRVTRTRGNWILELEGRPAIEVYREVARAPLAADLRRAAAFLLVALPCEGSDPLRPGGYRVRNVVGFSPERAGFALPEAVKPGDRVALVLREPEAAREDLKAMLAELDDDAPAFGLYLNCCARGASLFGIPGLEAAYLEQAFGECPIAGMFGSCEIGPIGGRTELLTYTGVLALLDG
jgi:small ligand-binding sensory domain FIST